MKKFCTKLAEYFNLFSNGTSTVDYVYTSDRCQYREFGVYADGKSLVKKYPSLAKDIQTMDVDHLLSDAYPHSKKLSSALQNLPEYLPFLKTTLQQDFFFAAFDQTSPDNDAPGKKRTGPKDVQKFILERIKSQLDAPRQNYEFVVEDKGTVVGYVELFDPKVMYGKKQYEWGVFVCPEHQANGYGKELLISAIDYAFKNLETDRIFATVDPDNIRSLNNIIYNGGGTQTGETHSKYSHLDGGGSKRLLFYIAPEDFYQAVENKSNQKYLIKGSNNSNSSKGADNKKGYSK